MKKFVVGFVIGALLFGIIPVMAEGELVVTPNPFHVLINGEVAQVEGYNINGYTYLKLADLSKAGLTVKFNETKRQIEITSMTYEERSEPSMEITITEYKNAEPPVKITGETPDGLKIYTIENTEYVDLTDIRDKAYYEKGYKPYYFSNEKKFQFKDKSGNVVLDNIPLAIFDNAHTIYIECDYYIDVIMPLMN